MTSSDPPEPPPVPKPDIGTIWDVHPVEVPGLDKQNGVTLGRVLGRTTVAEAEERSDGKMTATIRIPEDQFVYEQGILVLPHGGILELTLINDDNNTHCAVLPAMATPSSSGW